MIHYPALFLYEADHTIAAHFKPITYLLKDSLYLYDNCIIIDSSSRMIRISEAVSKGWAFFWGYHLLLKGRSVKIEFIQKSSENITLNQIKSLIKEKLDERWAPIFVDAPKKAKLLKRIVNSSSVKEVINCFLYDID